MVINSLLHRIPPSAIPMPASPLVHAVETTWRRPWRTPRQSLALARSECRTARAAHRGSRTVPIHRTPATASGDRDWREPDPVATGLAGQPPPAFRTGIRDYLQTRSLWHSLVHNPPQQGRIPLRGPRPPQAAARPSPECRSPPPHPAPTRRRERDSHAILLTSVSSRDDPCRTPASDRARSQCPVPAAPPAP